MKKMIKKILSILTAACLLALLSCNGIGGSGKIKDNSTSDEKAYITFSADLARFIVASQKLEESKVCKVELLVQKILSDGNTENVNLEESEWTSLEKLRKTTLELNKGNYNFYLNLYAETEIYEDGAYHLKLVQTAKIENKEIVAGNNTLSFNTSYVDTGDLAVGWEYSLAGGKTCPANYAIGTLYNIDDPENVKNITLWKWDDEEKKVRTFAVAEKNLDNGFYVLDVGFYDDQSISDGNKRYEGANLLATRHAVVAVNGFQTFKAFTIDFDDIVREGDAYPEEKEYQLELSVDSSWIGSNFTHIFSDLRYFPSNSKYLSQLNNLVAEGNYISSDNGRKLLKNSEGFLDLADKSKWLCNFDNNVDETDAEDTKRKISINETNNTLTMTRTVKVTPGLDGKGYFFLTILYENLDIPGYAIDCVALPANEIELKEGQVNRIVLSSYERDAKAPAGGEISWESRDVGGELFIQCANDLNRNLLNMASFNLYVLKRGEDPNKISDPEEAKNVCLEATDWNAKLLYGGKDINDFVPEGTLFYLAKDAKELRREMVQAGTIPEEYLSVINDEPSSLSLLVGIAIPDISEQVVLPLEVGGRYQLFVSCKVGDIVLSDTLDLDFEDKTYIGLNFGKPTSVQKLENELSKLQIELDAISHPVLLELSCDFSSTTLENNKITAINKFFEKINAISLPLELDISDVNAITQLSEDDIKNTNIHGLYLSQEMIDENAIKVGTEYMPCDVTICSRNSSAVKAIHKDAFNSASYINSITFEDEDGWWATQNSLGWENYSPEEGISDSAKEYFTKVEASDGKTVSQKLSEMLLAEGSENRWYIVNDKN